MRAHQGRDGGALGWRPVPVAVVVAIVLAGCGVLPLGESRMFGITFPIQGDGPGLIVSVADQTGRVVGLDVAEQMPDGQHLEASVVLMRHPVEPQAFIVGWLGGDCDIQTTFTLSPTDVGGASVAMRTEVEPGACEDLGIERVAIITMDGPVDLSRIDLEIIGDG